MIVWPWNFGPIQKSTKQQRLRKPADFWTYPKIRCADSRSCARGVLDQSKIHDTQRYESQRIFGLVQKSVGLIVVHVTVDFWTNPKIRHMNNAFKMFSNLGIRTKPFPSLKHGQTRCATGQWGVWLVVQGSRFHPSGLPHCRHCCSEDSAARAGCQGHLRRSSGRCPLLPSPFPPSARMSNDVLTARSACLWSHDSRNHLPVTRIRNLTLW